MEFVRLFRSLTVRQILGLQLAWTSSIALVFAVVTWLEEEPFHPQATDNVAFSMSLRWQLGVGQVLTLLAIVILPFVLWLVMRERSPRKP